MICRRDECGQDSDNCPDPDECNDWFDWTEVVIFVVVGAILAAVTTWAISGQAVLT